jgi:hypothetical protein
MGPVLVGLRADPPSPVNEPTTPKPRNNRNIEARIDQLGHWDETIVLEKLVRAWGEGGWGCEND